MAVERTPYEVLLATTRLRAEELRRRIGDPFPSPTDEWDDPTAEDF